MSNSSVRRIDGDAGSFRAETLLSRLVRIVLWLPPDLIRLLWAWQYRIPLLRSIVRLASPHLIGRAGEIRLGAGAGLKFNAAGSRTGFLLGTTDPQEQQALASELRPGGVFYDIGANIGFYAVIAARLVGPRGQVYAFEPFPESTERIQSNAALNGFENVRVFAVAVSDREGTTCLHLSQNSETHRIDWQRTVRPDEAEGSTAGTAPGMEVTTVALDRFIPAQGIRAPTVVMIDVEGAEILVLRGMSDTIRSCRPVILCEVHWINRAFNEFFEASLRPLGYTLHTLDGKPLPEEPARCHVIMRPSAATEGTDGVLR